MQLATFLSVPLIEDDLVNLVLELSENKKPKDLTSGSLYYANRLRRRATTTVISWSRNGTPIHIFNALQVRRSVLIDRFSLEPTAHIQQPSFLVAL